MGDTSTQPLNGSADEPGERKITELSVKVTIHELILDPHLDKLARSHDPYTRAKLNKRITQLLAGGGGPGAKYSLSLKDLAQYARFYGEQFVEDPWSDIERYFDVVNGLCTRPIPTQLAILYLFGAGKQYRPNLGTLSVAGEAVAGYCLEKFGYNPLVRPIGIMPDALMWKRGADELRLALCESKASVGDNPTKMIQDNAHEFIVDVKTRKESFSRNHYEAYLMCSQFKDGGGVEVACLYVDLGAYQQYKEGGLTLERLAQRVEPSDEPRARLRATLLMQASTVRAQDEYLAGLQSEEATRTATVAMMREKIEPKNIVEVDQYIIERARDNGVESEWRESQEIIGETKEREDESLKKALRRYRNPLRDADQQPEGAE